MEHRKMEQPASKSSVNTKTVEKAPAKRSRQPNCETNHKNTSHEHLHSAPTDRFPNPSSQLLIQTLTLFLNSYDVPKEFPTAYIRMYFPTPPQIREPTSTSNYSNYFLSHLPTSRTSHPLSPSTLSHLPPLLT